MQMGFGYYQSPEMKIPLFNFAEQFAAILAAIPGEIISEESRARAISALFDFSYADVGKVRQTSKAVRVTDATAKKKEEESGQAFGNFCIFPCWAQEDLTNIFQSLYRDNLALNPKRQNLNPNLKPY